MEIIKRKDAIRRGMVRYFTGKQCKHGHIDERYVVDGNCVTCRRNSFRKKSSTPEWRAAQSVRDRKRHAELMSSDSGKQLLTHKWRKWRSVNKDKIRKNSAINRKNVRKAKPIWFDEWHNFVFECAYEVSSARSRITGFKWHVDHMIPLLSKVACGLHVAENIQVIPARINQSKQNRFILTEPLEWLKLI